MYYILSPLEWWPENGGIYWIVARVLRKLLAVLAASTSSECTFLIFGLVDTAERLSLLGVWIEKRSISLQQYYFFINYKNIVLFFMLISKQLTNRWQWITNPATVHGNCGVNIWTVDPPLRGVAKVWLELESFFDLTTYLNDVQTDTFDSTCASRSELSDIDRQTVTIDPSKQPPLVE